MITHRNKSVDAFSPTLGGTQKTRIKLVIIVQCPPESTRHIDTLAFPKNPRRAIDNQSIHVLQQWSTKNPVALGRSRYFKSILNQAWS